MPAPITVQGPYRSRRRRLRTMLALTAAACLLAAVPFLAAALAAWMWG